MDENLFDEFGNYIGPEVDQSDSDHEEGEQPAENSGSQAASDYHFEKEDGEVSCTSAKQLTHRSP